MNDLSFLKVWPPRVTNFPAPALLPPYFKVIRPDLRGTTWTWHPTAGLNGEWWGPAWSGDCASNGTVTNNRYLRLKNGSPMNASRGYVLDRRYRIFTFKGSADSTERGAIQFRVNGASNGRSVIWDGKTVAVELPNDSDLWLVGGFGSVQTLGVTWQSGSTGDIQSPHVEFYGCEVRLSNE